MFTPEKRSAIMRAVKSEGTAPERRLATALERLGLVPARNVKSLPGSPDLVIARAQLAIFVHGCFWHGHACPRGRRAPKTNAAYWSAKVARNIARDRKAARALRRLGFSVSIVWECRLSEADGAARRIGNRLKALRARRGAAQIIGRDF